MDDLKGFVTDISFVLDGVFEITILTEDYGIITFTCFDTEIVSSLFIDDLINVYLLERTVFDYGKQRLSLEFFAYKISILESHKGVLL